MAAQAPVLYAEAIEGFFQRSIGRRLSPTARRKLKDAGLDLDQKLKPTYPLEHFRKFVDIARIDVYPNLPLPAAYRKIGEDTVAGYTETVIGKALASMFRLLGPLRTLNRLDSTSKGVNNFTQTRLTKLEDGAYDYWFNELSINSDYTTGLIQAALRVCGAKEVQVAYLGSVTPHTFRLRWS